MKSVKDFHVRKSIPTSTSRKDTSIVQTQMNPDVALTIAQVNEIYCHINV